MNWLIESPWFSVTAPITAGTHCRSPGLTDQIVAQFDVAHHPRYKARDLSGTGRIDTLCNIFVSDVTRALGCEANHLEMGPDGKPVELSANALIRWLINTGPRHGWVRSSTAEAPVQADDGKVVVAAWLSPPGGIGHVAMVVPSFGKSGILISQAGARNFEREPVDHGFARLPVMYFMHP